MISGVAIGSWLAIGYAALLVLIAYGIDTFARRSAAKVEETRVTTARMARKRDMG